MDQDSLDDWIISLLSGHSVRQVDRLVHVGLDRVRAVRDAHISGRKFLHRLGAPRKANPEIKQAVIDLTIDHPNFSDLQIAQMIAEQYAITLSRVTINCLRHVAHLRFLPPKRCQKLTEPQRRQWVQFARDFCRGALPSQNLVFTDESRFSMGPDNRWIWGRRGEYEDTVFAETDKYSQISVHLWGAIGVGFKSKLIFFEKTVNSEVYVDSLKSSGFVGLADATFGERRWYLVQDGASCHTSAQSLNALFEVCNVYPSWPPNSPDLNPIESLWGAIKRRLQRSGIRTREEAIQIIHTVWSEFEQGSIDSLVSSFSNRVEMMRETEVRTIQPLISAGKTQVPPGYAAALTTPLTWNEETDAVLDKLVETRGRKWKEISTIIGTFTDHECKNRWTVLKNMKRLR